MLTIQLLDLWEAKVIHQLNPRALGTSVEESVRLGVQNIKNSYPFFNMTGNFSGKSCHDQECAEVYMNDLARRFFEVDSRVVRLRGHKLVLTEDAYEVAKPANCEFEQAINYRPDGTILIDQDLYDHLSAVDQAGIILHEAYYALLRHFAKETNSLRTRRVIGQVMSGKVFEIKDPPVFSKMAIHCQRRLPHSAATEIFIYDTPNSNVEGRLSLYVVNVHGSALIDADQPLGSFSFGTDFKKNLLSGRCVNKDELNIFSTGGLGTIESDHFIELSFMCNNHVQEVYVTDQRPGQPEQTSLLHCNASERVDQIENNR